MRFLKELRELPAREKAIVTELSTEYDSEGNQLTKAQADFFKRSKIRDKDDNLLVVYHGTDVDFTVFDKNKIGTNAGYMWGAGFYFTYSQELANDYGNVNSYYLNIKNPFNIFDYGSYRKVVDLLDKYNIKYKKDILEDKFDNLPSGIEEDIDLIDFIYDIWDSGGMPMKTISKIIQDEGFDGILVGNEVVAFYSNQIKSIINKNPTSSENINEDGYDGYSMSNNARMAYADNEMPLSKWNKTNILNSIQEFGKNNKLNFDITELKKVPLSMLKSKLLYKSSWHHTGSWYNETDFYSLDETALEELTNQTIEEWQGEKEHKKPEEEKVPVIATFTEWTGSRRYPKAIEMTKDGYIKGNWFYSDDGIYKKNINSKYFDWEVKK